MGKTMIHQLRQSKLRKPGPENNPAIRRKYDGPINLLKPTFYISEALGENPAELVRDLIDGDKRFFEPACESQTEIPDDGDASDYNYNENVMLTQAIEKGARGAYWHILRQLRE